MLTVRAARIDDLAAITQLERYCFPPELAFGHKRWQFVLDQPKSRTLLLLDEEEKLMGYLCTVEHRGWNRLVVLSLAIRWTVRRQGWARRLLEQAIAEGKSAGWGGIMLEVAETNVEARALYQGLGFRSRLQLPDYYGPGRHGERLLLLLPSADGGKGARGGAKE